jgi:hypothetical protein
MKKLITGVVAGVIVFAWGMFSWMVLPWHKATFGQYQNEVITVKALQLGAPEAGMYVYPPMDTKPEDMKGKPHILTTISYKEKQMAVCMTLGLLVQVLAALALACLLGMANVTTLKDRLKIICKAVAFAFFVGILPNWLWYSFSWQHTLLCFADLVIAWTLAGLWIAKRA